MIWLGIGALILLALKVGRDTRAYKQRCVGERQEFERQMDMLAERRKGHV